MIENLIVINRNNKIYEVIDLVFYLLKNIPVINFILFSFKKSINLKYLRKKLPPKSKYNNFKILYLDKITCFKYKVPSYEFKNRYINLLKNGREVLDYVEKETNRFDKNYRNLDMHMVYENNMLIYCMWDVLELNLSIQILLEKYVIKKIFLPEDQNLIFNLFQLNIKNPDVKLYHLKLTLLESLLNKIIENKTIILPLIIPFYNIYRKRIKGSEFLKDEHFDSKIIVDTNAQNIGFLYFAITHKRVGNPIFEFLSKNGFNVIEINPIPPYKFKRFIRKKNSKNIIFGLRKLYKEYEKYYQNSLFSLFLNEALKRITQQIDSDLYIIDYIYKVILDNDLDLLILFNDNSFLGKISTLICKQLNIPTLFFQHGGITETYIFVHPKWCDIMILNSKFEIEFLLQGKLDPTIYSNKLIALGNIYLKPQNLKKIVLIRDIYDKTLSQLLNAYKYKILLAMGYELGKNSSYTNLKIINDIITILKYKPEFQDILLIIKLHPLDYIKNYQSFFKKLKNSNVIVTNEGDIRNYIYSVDLFLTTPSSTILEGILLKTPTIILDYYYDPGNYLFHDKNVITAVQNQEGLEKQLMTHLLDKKFRKDYVNKTYNFALKFCTDYNDDNFLKNYYRKLLEIIIEQIKKKNS